MGYFAHNAIVVTTWCPSKIENAFNMARKLFGNNRITNILQSYTNGYYTFFVGPDGSKEGWDTSEKNNLLRGQFIDYLNEVKVNGVDVRYGGDEEWLAKVETHTGYQAPL